MFINGHDLQVLSDVDDGTPDDDAVVNAEDAMHDDGDGVLEFPSAQRRSRGTIRHCIVMYSSCVAMYAFVLCCNACYSMSAVQHSNVFALYHTVSYSDGTVQYYRDVHLFLCWR